MKLEIEYLHEDMDPLYRAYPDDAGADVPIWHDIVVKHGRNQIDLGFKMKVPRGYVGYLNARSSVMGDGIICNPVPFDSFFSNVWNLIIYNVGEEFTVKKGERICQLVIMPVVTPDFVTEPIRYRGDNGLGSTGK